MVKREFTWERHLRAWRRIYILIGLTIVGTFPAVTSLSLRGLPADGGDWFFALDRMLWPSSLLGYRFVGLALHVLAAVLLFRFVIRISRNKDVVFAATLLWAVLPTSIVLAKDPVGRGVVLAMMFVVLTLGFHLRAMERLNHRRGLHYVLALSCFGLAALSGNIGRLAIPLVFLLGLREDRRPNWGVLVATTIPYLLLLGGIRWLLGGSSSEALGDSWGRGLLYLSSFVVLYLVVYRVDLWLRVERLKRIGLLLALGLSFLGTFWVARIS